MNKDILVASIIGFSLGLIGAVALWIVPKYLPKNKPAQNFSPKPVVEEQNDSEKNTDLVLELDSLKDGDIFKTADLNLIGKANNAKMVTITTPNMNEVMSPDQEGSFSAKIKLTEGGNPIVITAYDHKKEIAKNLFLYYFNEE